VGRPGRSTSITLAELEVEISSRPNDLGTGHCRKLAHQLWPTQFKEVVDGRLVKLGH
jgi:hypothetical protein